MTLTLSPQQSDIMDWVENGSGSAFVEAVAGAGKTTTLIEACKLMEGSVSLCAFNKKIADEINTRLQPLGLHNVRAGTFHSFGFAAWRKYAGRVVVDERGKTKDMIKENEVPDPFYGATKRLVSLAKQSGCGLIWQPEDVGAWTKIIHHHNLDLEFDDESDVDRLIELSQRCIEWARDDGEIRIDFDDMIWLPVTTKGVRFQKHDWILVDEAQDTNPVRRILASSMLARDGRMLWVGDRHQAIYGFTGADSDAIDQIIDHFQCDSLPLTVTYRCPKAVVRTAQQWVSHIEAHETAPEGDVRHVDIVDFEEKECDALTPNDVVLCRNTKPLVELAFQLIRMGIGCHVEGRDIGQGLIKMATRWKRVKTVVHLVEKLETYRDLETAKIMARGGDEYLIESLNDRIDTLLVLTDGCELVTDLVVKINDMFRDTTGKPSTVTLSTVHKAKGREWDRVFILGFDVFMPSRYAKKHWQRQQETNLMYVAATRAKQELVLQLGQ